MYLCLSRKWTIIYLQVDLEQYFVRYSSSAVPVVNMFVDAIVTMPSSNNKHLIEAVVCVTNESKCGELISLFY